MPIESGCSIDVSVTFSNAPELSFLLQSAGRICRGEESYPHRNCRRRPLFLLYFIIDPSGAFGRIFEHVAKGSSIFLLRRGGWFEPNCTFSKEKLEGGGDPHSFDYRDGTERVTHLMSHLLSLGYAPSLETDFANYCEFVPVTVGSASIWARRENLWESDICSPIRQIAPR